MEDKKNDEHLEGDNTNNNSKEIDQYSSKKATIRFKIK